MPTDDQQSVSNLAALCMHLPNTSYREISVSLLLSTLVVSSFIPDTSQSPSHGRTEEMNMNRASSLLCVGLEWRSSSPLLQYCSSRLVLSYRLPHEATRSDILPDLLLLLLLRLPAFSFLSAGFPPFPPFVPLSVSSSRRHPFPSPPHSQADKHTSTCPGSPSTLPLLSRHQRQARSYVTNCTSATCFQNKTSGERYVSTFFNQGQYFILFTVQNTLIFLNVNKFIS